MATSAIVAALSIISLVIFFAPCASTCAHNTTGNRLPASPIPEHALMKSRRSSILFLQSIGDFASAYDTTDRGGISLRNEITATRLRSHGAPVETHSVPGGPTQVIHIDGLYGFGHRLGRKRQDTLSAAARKGW